MGGFSYPARGEVWYTAGGECCHEAITSAAACGKINAVWERLEKEERQALEVARLALAQVEEFRERSMAADKKRAQCAALAKVREEWRDLEDYKKRIKVDPDLIMFDVIRALGWADDPGAIMAILGPSGWQKWVMMMT